MKNFEIQMTLEEAYEKPFLEKVEFIIEKEKDYKKSEFFKNTKISFATLYEKFEMYQSRNTDIIDEFNKFVQDLDIDIIVQKVSEFLEKAEKDKKIVDVLNDLIDNFNVDRISEYATKIQEELTKVK